MQNLVYVKGSLGSGFRLAYKSLNFYIFLRIIKVTSIKLFDLEHRSKKEK